VIRGRHQSVSGCEFRRTSKLVMVMDGIKEHAVRPSNAMVVYCAVRRSRVDRLLPHAVMMLMIDAIICLKTIMA
jgi:hypothetical protein